MSAFMVSTDHIDALLTAGMSGVRRYGPLRWMVPAPVNEHAYQAGEPWGPEASQEYEQRRRELTEETAGQVGAMLLAENRRSVDHRYAEEEIEEPYLYHRYPRNVSRAELRAQHEAGTLPRPLAPVDILKMIECYEYQSCEHPEWETSEAHAFCQALRMDQISKLEGYEDAPWDIG